MPVSFKRAARAPVALCTLAILGGLGGLLAALHPAPAAAADTQWWILDSPPDYAKAESRGVVVRPDGSLELGPQAVSSPIESLSVVWAAVPLRDGSVALAGDHGRILRWTEAGGAKPWAKLPAGQVLSLAPDGAGVVAGTGPEGLVYRISASGDTTLLARTGERYVWGLAPAADGAWYAATGTRGRLLRIQNGRVRVLLDTEESNLVCILPDGRGGVYAGGDSKGRIVQVRADGSARTVFDASEDEVRALALGPDGALFAAGLSVSASSDDDEAEGPVPAKAATGGKATVYRIVPDSSSATYWTSPQSLVFALLGTPRGAGNPGVVAATGNRAGLYLLERPGGHTLWLAVPQGQVTALAADARGRLYAATSNPAVLWRVGPERAARGELLSMSLDARRIARFGRTTWQGQAGGGRVTLATRTGNTDKPDTTWSPWQGVAGDGQGGRVQSPPARYLQWRLTLAGGSPHVASVESAWREQNQPPRLEDVLVAPQGQGFREGEIQPRMDPVTQTLKGGQRVEYTAPPAASPRGLRDLPMWARGLRTVQWRASDPNGDPLRFRLDVRPEPAGEWQKVEEDLEPTSYTWDTSSLPDGRYRLRVSASDAPGNALGEELRSEAVSQPFVVDNTPPAVEALQATPEPGAIAVAGRAEDATSPLQRVELSLDDAPWRAVSPDGGFTDDRSASFRVQLPEVAPGQHSVSVRVVDLAGNSAVRALRVTVPGAVHR